jgi:voltage-gated potassium channel
MPSNKPNETPRFFQVIVMILSVFILVSLAVSSFFPLSEQTRTLLDHIDDGICILLLIDFIVRFRRAENKWHFLRWGWIDLLASIPTLDYFRVGRVVRIIRVIRVLRAFRSTHLLLRHLFYNKPRGALATASIIAVLLVIFSSISILQVEDVKDANIKTAEDALWW